MSSTAPRTLGPYEILAPLGAGGMGEVFRARDTRLGREVALKILQGDVAKDADRRARFEREARTVASLNHPNIVALFEVGNADGVEYTVSELVDGESLRALLAREGALPVRRVVELATQLADGMAAAHAAGIVHRDLKPENVMLTRDGRVKVLDFGLARVASAVFGNSSAETVVADSPTQYMTSPGMVLGTAAYMSPEQAKGNDADYRSDQFSFGLIAYEMLNGKQAFARPSAVETMAAIVREEPEPLDGKVPVTLRWVVERCLEKDAGQRFDSTKDLYQQLRMLRDHFSEVVSGSSSTALQAVPAAPAQKKSASILWLTALLAALAIGAVAFWLLQPRGTDLSKYKYTPIAVNAAYPVGSPDGKMVAYGVLSGPNVMEIDLRSLASPTSQQLTHAGGYARPIQWSPDSSHIFYTQSLPGVDGAKLYSIAAVGGDPELVWDMGPKSISGFRNATAVSPDGKSAAGLMRGEDGAYDVYISDPLGSAARRYPDSHVATRKIFNAPKMAISPDGKWLLLIRAGDRSGGEESWLLPWPAGSGTPQRVLAKMPITQGTPYFAWMPDSRHVLATLAPHEGDIPHIFLADTKSDSLEQITQGTRNERSMSVGPDGSSILFAEGNTEYDIVSLSLADGTTKPLVVTGQADSTPAMAANADVLAFNSDRLGTEDIWVCNGGADRPLVTRASFAKDPPKWMFAAAPSPDGQRVIFESVPYSGVSRLWMASISGGTPVLLTSATDQDEDSGDWSPDGRQFAFLATDEKGERLLEVVRTTGGAKPEILARRTDFAGLPSWSPDGKWIAWTVRGGDAVLVSPDGKQTRSLGKVISEFLAWSKDSNTLYGIRYDGPKLFLFSLDLRSEPAKLHDIKQLDPSLRPSSSFGPGIRFSLAPDGNSIIYSVQKEQSSIWMLTGWRLAVSSAN